MEGIYEYPHRQGYTYFQESIICPHFSSEDAYAWDKAMRGVRDTYAHYRHWMSSHRKNQQFAKENAAIAREATRDFIKKVREIEAKYPGADNWNPHKLTAEGIRARVKAIQVFY